VDLIDNDLLVGKPVIIPATAGTARPALVVDDHRRAAQGTEDLNFDSTLMQLAAGGARPATSAAPNLST
jgi:hypothetical protein